MASERKTQGESTELVKVEEKIQAALQNFNPEEAVKQGGWQTEVYHKMNKKGDVAAGLFLGPGPATELKPDEETGEVKELGSWRVQVCDVQGKPIGIILRIPAVWELDQFFKSLTPGNTMVWLRFIEKQQIHTRQVSRFDKLQQVRTDLQATGPSIADLEAKAKREAKSVAQAEAAAKAQVERMKAVG